MMSRVVSCRVVHELMFVCLSQEIGHGHYGTVRRCKNRETDVIYAIKTIKKSKVWFRNKRSYSFLDILEIYWLARSHNYIIQRVKSYDVFEICVSFCWASSNSFFPLDIFSMQRLIA